MPPIRVTPNVRADVSKSQQAFAFPKTHHLLITTESKVWSWDYRGLTSAFISGSAGILAAKEIKDGSALLAVADDHIVVLHSAIGNANRSYRLKGTDGQVRMLEYSNDSKSLFFTTSHQNAVQSYSICQARLLEPSHTHPSPPTVFATSSTSHLMLSASQTPPTIFLQSLVLRTPALLLQPGASCAAVEAAAFHPERTDIFLLAFRDGTLAVYDATRLLLSKNRQRPPQSHGEIAYLRGLHAVASRLTTGLRASTRDDQSVMGDRCVSITSAAFLPGHRTRVVSVGADGLCRLVDFEDGGNILRTWHAEGPATSLSILSVQQEQTRSPANRTETGAPNNTLAVGREDGKVLIFDSLGIVLSEQIIDTGIGRILDVEWIKGPGPNPQLGDPNALDQHAVGQIKSCQQGSSVDEAAFKGSSDTGVESVEALVDSISSTVNLKLGDTWRQQPQTSVVDYPGFLSSGRQASIYSLRRDSPRRRRRPHLLSSTFRRSFSSPESKLLRVDCTPQSPKLDPQVRVMSMGSSKAVGIQKIAKLDQTPEGKSSTYLPYSVRPYDTHRSVTTLPRDINIDNASSRKASLTSKGISTLGENYGSSTSLSSSRIVTSSSKGETLADIRYLEKLGEAVEMAGLATLVPYVNHGGTACGGQQMHAQEAKPKGTKLTVVAHPIKGAYIASDDEYSVSHVQPSSYRQSLRSGFTKREMTISPPDRASRQYSQPTSVAGSFQNDKNMADHCPYPTLPYSGAISQQEPVNMPGPFPFMDSVNSERSDGGSKVKLPALQHFQTARVIDPDRIGCGCGRKCCSDLWGDVQTLRTELRMIREEIFNLKILMDR